MPIEALEILRREHRNIERALRALLERVSLPGAGTWSTA